MLIAAGASAILTRSEDHSPAPDLLALRDDLDWSVNASNCVWHHEQSWQAARRTWLPQLRRRMAEVTATARLARRDIPENQQDLFDVGLDLASDVLAMTQGQPRDVDAMNGTLGVFREEVLELEGAPEEAVAARRQSSAPRTRAQECRSLFNGSGS